MFRKLSRTIRTAWRRFRNDPYQLFLDQALMANQHTPDVSSLEKHRAQFLFVCDDMQQGHPAHNLLGQHIHITKGRAIECLTLNKKLALWKFWYQNGRDVTIVPFEYRAVQNTYIKHLKLTREGIKTLQYPPGRIKGEIFAVRPYQLIELDKHFENGVKFERRKVTVLIPHRFQIAGKTKGNFQEITDIDVWMYFGIPKAWEAVLNDPTVSCPVRVYTASKPQPGFFDIGNYYRFTNREYAK